MPVSALFIHADRSLDPCPIVPLLADLAAANNRVVVASADPRFGKRCGEHSLPACRFRIPNCSRLAFAPFLLPFLFPYLIVALILRKRRFALTAVILFDPAAIIAVTPAARILGLRVLWLGLPETAPASYPAPVRSLFRRFRRHATVAAIGAGDETAWRSCLGSDARIVPVLFGRRRSLTARQDSIFDTLASSNSRIRRRKFFTVGTVFPLTVKRPIEFLFQAAEKARQVIPNLQIIIIGDGSERKDLNWTAKKLGIDGLVWFVGDQPILGKWFASFDCYALVAPSLSLSALSDLVGAAVARKPLIAAVGAGADAIVIPDRTGYLVDFGDSEALAGAIIALEQDRRRRDHYGAAAAELVDRDFRLDTMVRTVAALLTDTPLDV